MDLGKTRCRNCRSIIYAWLDECPQCGVNQGKDELTLAQRILRSGSCIPRRTLDATLEEGCARLLSERTVRLLERLGIATYRQVLLLTYDELRALVGDEEAFREVCNCIGYVDTRPITNEERVMKARLFGSVRWTPASNEPLSEPEESVCHEHLTTFRMLSNGQRVPEQEMNDLFFHARKCERCELGNLLENIIDLLFEEYRRDQHIEESE